MLLTSYADILLARHAIFPNVGEEILREEPKECLRRRLICYQNFSSVSIVRITLLFQGPKKPNVTLNDGISDRKKFPEKQTRMTTVSDLT